MRHPAPLPPDLAGQAFTTTDAAAAGVTRGRTRSRDLSAPFRGVRMPANELAGIRQLCRAYSTRMPSGQCFSHVTAAKLHGIPLPWKLENDGRIHVSSVGGAGHVRMRGVVAHRLADAQVVEVGGLRVTSPVETWRQLSTLLSFTDLVAVGDALVRRQHPFASMSELAEAVSGHRSHRGARLLQRAFCAVRPGVDSPMETVIRLLLLRAGLPEPLVNATILNGYGAFVALGDMVYPDYRVLVEYDGGHHFATTAQMHHDIDRLDELMEEKWRVIRLNKSHLSRPSYVIHKVRTALEDAGWTP